MLTCGRDKDATRSQPAPSISAEGALIDEWCASAAATLWAEYVTARDAWGPPLMYYIPLSANDARLRDAYFKARAALAAWLIGCSERGEIELWARPGSRIEDTRLIPPSAVRALTVDYKKRTAEGPPGEGLPRLYDMRVRQAATASPSVKRWRKPPPANAIEVAALAVAKTFAPANPPTQPEWWKAFNAQLGEDGPVPRKVALRALADWAPHLQRQPGQTQRTKSNRRS